MALTLHIGAHKTASTHLQQTLRALTGAMVREGILYLDPVTLRRGSGRLDLSLDNGPKAARRRGPWRRWMDRAAEVWPSLLLSEENALGSLRRGALMGEGGLIYPEAERRMDRLCNIARRRPAVVCLAVRDPLSFLGSAFSMQVVGGHETEFADYIGGFDPAALSWSGLAERLLSVRGVARLVVWRHEDYPRARPEVLRAMLPEALAAHAPNPRRAIVGLSQEAWDEIRRRRESDPDADLAEVARAAKAQFPRRRGAPPPQFAPPAAVARVAAAHAEDLTRLAALEGVEMIGTPARRVRRGTGRTGAVTWGGSSGAEAG